MKVIDKLHAIEGNSSPHFSFEFFPPKTEAGTENLYMRMERMTQLEPLFVNVTWGAGGSTKDLTMSISQYAQTYFGVEVLMHLTCTNLTVEELKKILNKARAAGIQNILALRGDPPKGAIKWTKAKGGLENAIDLIRLIRQEHGDYFCIAVAGFPEGHPANAPPIMLSPSKKKEMFSSDQSAEDSRNGRSASNASAAESSRGCTALDIQHLKDKIDAGADFVLTQFFYDTQVFLDYIGQCRASGIECPIVPGIMPIQGFNSFEKMTSFCRTKVPEEVWSDLKPIRENDEEVKSYGVRLCVDMCKKLHSAGVQVFHFYTLNLEKSVMLILAGLGVKDSVSSRRALPWRGSRTGRSNTNIASMNKEQTLSTPDAFLRDANTNSQHQASKECNSTVGNGNNGSSPQISQNPSQVSLSSGGNLSDSSRTRVEDVRPINWANRPKSYIKRTVTWDEFPNGRWGDGRSPAFGELSDSHFFRPSEGSKEDRLAMWGEAPLEERDVYEIFALYVEGKIPILPWCETATQDETHVISSALAAFNRAGFLTINSQPAVNGEKSTHPIFGWGGPDGRVYQKAYIEFFTSPENLKIIMEVARDKPHLNLHAVDSSGNHLYHGSKGVTALTWGVFPNKEILQPTIFDSDTFLVWTEEAFQLWTSAWASLYDDETDSAALLYDIHDRYYLVAIVDNEYIESDLYSVFGETMMEKVRRREHGIDAALAEDLEGSTEF